MMPVFPRGFFLPLAFLFILTPSAVEPVAGAQESSGGRWIFTLEDAHRRIEMPADLRILPTGRATLVLLGKTGGDEGLFQGVAGDGKLELEGSYFGLQTRIELRLAGGSAAGTLESASGRLAIAGSRDTIQASEVPVAKYHMLFEAAWNGVNLYYFDPALKGLDWNAVQARYAPLVRAARNDGEIIVILRKMLRELKSSHTELYLSTGNSQETRKTPRVEWRRLDGETCYLALRYFSADRLQEFDRELEAAMDRSANSHALVIDLRGNDGRNIESALAALNFLLPDSRAVAYFATRDGLRNLGLKSIDQITPSALPTAFVDDYPALSKFRGAGMYLAGGKYKLPFGGKIAVLIDETCRGSCEIVADALKDAGAELVGRKTPGEVLLSQDVDFQFISWSRMARGKVKSWLMELPNADVRAVRGGKIEGSGVKPDIVVARSGSSDAELKVAQARLIK